MLGKAQGLFPNSEAKGRSSEKALNETPNSELRHDTYDAMATPFLAGLAVAATALAGRYGIQAWHAFKTRPPKPRMRKFYEDNLFVWFHRENAPADKVKEANRKVMVANHPDAGGSHYLASKINEAKDVMLGKTKGSGSAF
ncbi:hypothetical protein ACE6H2_008249 [Prunus campanulata]